MHTIPAPHIEDTENPIGPEHILSISRYTAGDHLIPSLLLSVPAETKRIAYACYAIVLRGTSRQTCQLACSATSPICLLTDLGSLVSVNRGIYPAIPNLRVQGLDSVSTVRGANAPTSRAGGLIWNGPEGITMLFWVSTVKC